MGRSINLVTIKWSLHSLLCEILNHIMVRYIYITKNVNFQPHQPSIISFRDFCNQQSGVDDEQYIDRFNDMTQNFTDLCYWYCKKNLHGKNLSQLATKIKQIVSLLESIAYEKKI